MATSCPIDLDVDQLRREISFIYARVADDPAGDFHFHRGAEYAVSLLGYDAADVAAIPAANSASFAGVGNPHCVAAIAPGETVVDIGCGAGTDLLLAARKVGARGESHRCRHDSCHGGACSRWCACHGIRSCRGAGR